jgi:heme exporter protein C
MKSLYTRLLPWTCLVSMLVSLYAIFLYAPTERTMGDVQRIFYFHISAWWIAGVALLVVFLASVAYLWKRERRFDAAALASTEIGVLFMTIGITTGPIWAKPIWGIYWTWDPRLTSALVCWLMYVAILMLRRYIPEESKRSNLAAVAGIIAFVNVPFVFMTIRLFRTQHPQPVIGGGDESGLAPAMTHAFLITLVAFTFLYLWLMQQRLEVEATEQQVDDLHKELELA